MMMHFTDVSSRRGDSAEESSSSSTRKPHFPKLFGRNDELEELLRLCSTVRLSFLYGSEDFNHRPPLLVLLTGPSGCGKTALAQEFERRIIDQPPQSVSGKSTGTGAGTGTGHTHTGDFTSPREQRRVVFVSGKVDQFQRHLPYAPIIQALDEIGRMLLDQMPSQRSESGNEVFADLEYIRDLKRIRRLLRHEGKTLVQLVPNLARFMEMKMDSVEEEDAISSSPTEDLSCVAYNNGNDSDLHASHASTDNNISNKNEVMTEQLIFLAVQAFVRIFVRIHPLVWFVDDLQWADTSSLRLLRTLIVDHQLPHLLFVMGCRDVLTASSVDRSNNPNNSNDISNANIEDQHQVALLDFWASADRKVEMSLENLQVSVLTEWLAHLLSADVSKVRPLAEVVHTKTDGNPYFILNYLELLQRKQLLRYRYHSETWDWSLDDIVEPTPRQRQTGGGPGTCQNRSSLDPESLEDVVAMQIASQPLLVQQLLQVASCLGFFFDETLLKGLLQSCDSLLLMGFSHVSALCNLEYEEDNNDEDDFDCLNPQDECSEDNEAANRAYLKALYKAEEEGLIRQTRDPKIYQFTHDRVQQTLYQSMANGKEIALLHLRIGQYIKELEDEQYILEAAEQLNRGSLLLVHEMERLDLIELNLEVSTHARKRGGIILMANYLEKGVALVKERDWTRSYDMVLEIFTRSAEAEAARGRFAKSEECIAVILANAKTPDDTVRARYVRMQTLGMQGYVRQAFREAKSMLNELGERLPPSNPISSQMECKRTRRLLRDMSDADIESLAPITDSRKLWIAKIMRDAATFAWSCDPTFAVYMFMRLLSFSLQNGSCESTPFALSVYGSVAVKMGHDEEGTRFADLSLRLVKEKSAFPAVAVGAYSGILQVKQSCRQSLRPLLSAYKIGLETGDIHFGCLSLSVYILCYQFCGAPLASFAESLQNFVSQLHLCGQSYPLSYATLSLKLVLSLREESDTNLYLDACTGGDIFTKDVNLAENVTHPIFSQYLQAFYAYILGDLESAEKNVKKSNFAKLPGTHIGNIFHAFIDGLVYSALYQKTGQIKYLRNAARVTKWISTIAEKQPQNCAGMLFLLEAEQKSFANAKEREWIKEQYDNAIKAFHYEGFLHFEAIANERAGEFMARCGYKNRQRVYVSAAMTRYEEWGATMKVKALEAKIFVGSVTKCNQHEKRQAHSVELRPHHEKGPLSSVRTARTSVASSFGHQFLSI